MSEAYLGEIALFSMSYAPQGWHICDGTILQISSNAALYSLLGTTYGGDGRTTFALPDLRGRVPINYGQSTTRPNSSYYKQGATGGSEGVPLTAANLPPHNHALQADGENATAIVADGVYFAMPVVPNTTPSTSLNRYVSPTAPNNVALNPGVIDPAGAGAAHNNMQPFLVLNYCICTQGYYPPRQ